MHPTQVLPAYPSAPEPTIPTDEQPREHDPSGPMVYVDAICPRCEQRGLRLPPPDGSAVGPVCAHCGSPLQMGDF
jgi:hypothetical protein